MLKTKQSEKMKRNDNYDVAKNLIRLAKDLLADEEGTTQSMTKEEMLDFLYSQVKQVEINVKLPEIEESADNKERNAAQRYPQQNKKKRIKKILDQQNKEENEVKNITDEWKALAATIDSLPDGNNGNPFYGKEFIVRVLNNRSIQVNITSRNRNVDLSTTNLNPYDEINKNNPFIYDGINNINDYRDFIVKKFNSNQMEFKKCFLKPYDFDMPLEVYKTQAKPKIYEYEIDVYVKFGVHKKKAKVDLEFENYSFHPLQEQSNPEPEKTDNSN